MGEDASTPPPLVERVVVDPLTRETEDAYGELRKREKPELSPHGEPVGHVPTGQAPAPEPRHEGGDGECHRVGVGTAEKSQHSLPEDLIEERGEAREKKENEHNKDGDSVFQALGARHGPLKGALLYAQLLTPLARSFLDEARLRPGVGLRGRKRLASTQIGTPFRTTTSDPSATKAVRGAALKLCRNSAP